MKKFHFALERKAGSFSISNRLVSVLARAVSLLTTTAQEGDDVAS